MININNGYNNSPKMAYILTITYTPLQIMTPISFKNEIAKPSKSFPIMLFISTIGKLSLIFFQLHNMFIGTCVLYGWSTTHTSSDTDYNIYSLAFF